MLDLLIWNGSPEIFSSFVTVRWYSILYAGGFLLSQQVMYYMYRKEGKPVQDVDTLLVYTAVATILGARLGHILFYEPEFIFDNPLGVLLPVQYTPNEPGFLGLPVKFTGFLGLASHGGALGILFALWLYSKKKKKDQNYLQVLDRIVIVVALTAAMIRLGNFFNSEIIGKPTNIFSAVVFVNPITKPLLKHDSSPISDIDFSKEGPANAQGQTALVGHLTFKPDVDENTAELFIENDLRYVLSQADVFFYQPYVNDLHYTINKQAGTLTADFHTTGIARHPAQLYESVSYLLLFGLLFFIWSKRKENTPQGLIFGLFMIIMWSLRFAYEFLKENQVPFEEGMAFNMGQILSIPFVVVGIIFTVRAFKKPDHN